MDHELKQRLIGAVVVTALAAIFMPMLFDDPVETNGKEIAELTLPSEPSAVTPQFQQKLPDSKEQVLNRSDTDLKVTEVEDNNQAGDGNQTSFTDGEQTEHLIQSNPTTAMDAPQGNKATLPSTNPSGQGGETGLDTGYVGEAPSGEHKQENLSAPKTEEKLPQTGKPKVLTPAANERPKVEAKPVADKTITKVHKEKSAKSSSKLVRYSIQAGSFNKKENAEALVSKLRKQGMPATIIAKGDYFRVKIGPSLDREKAKEMKSKLDKLKIKGLLTSE